jgi:hypothetical protein
MDRHVLHSKTDHFARRLDTQNEMLESICLACFCTVHRSREMDSILMNGKQHDCPMVQERKKAKGFAAG